jgi:sugar phosphate isomerase/epimerase
MDLWLRGEDMRIGAITNSWGIQIHGDNLPDLVTQARDRGARHIELRQTFLGDFETGKGDDWRPVIEGLRSLPGSFPDLSFNLAMGIPCLSGGVAPDGPLFQQALEAARAVGRDAPHLRLVDPSPQEKAWEDAGDIPEEALAVTDLARAAAARGITMSLENSGQSVGALTMLVQVCRQRLSGGDGAFLGLCPDPANQIRRQPETDALGDLDAVPLDMLKIVHFKQAREGRAIPTVDDGDLDCGRMVRILESKGYTGPAIFEIPSHEDVFDNLSSSFNYIRGFSSDG